MRRRCQETYSLAAWDEPETAVRVVRCQKRGAHDYHRWHGGPMHLMPGLFLDRTTLYWRDGFASVEGWDYTMVVRKP